MLCCCCSTALFSEKRKQTTTDLGGCRLGSVSRVRLKEPDIEHSSCITVEQAADCEPRSNKDERSMDQPLTTDEERCQAAGRKIRLTPRQAEVLALVAQGASDNEIAMRLCLSAKTVSWYVKEIRAQLGARSRAHAVALALQHGLLSEMSMPEQEP